MNRQYYVYVGILYIIYMQACMVALGWWPEGKRAMGQTVYDLEKYSVGRMKVGRMEWVE